MADDQPIFEVEQANTSASATAILADLTSILFFFLCDSDIMADDQPVLVADQANTSASATTILADLTAIFFLIVSVSKISLPMIS